MSNDKDKPEPSEHVGILLGECESHGGQHIAFERDGKPNIGVLKPLEEGKPLDPDSELVEVRSNGTLAVFRSHGKVGRATSQGPAMVNDKAYRKGWERIFGPKTNNALN